MTMPRLREQPEELEVYVSRIAEVSGIPADHVEKDFWVTEALRGVALASADLGCSVVFKGGTSLSKAHRLIQRFSEDVDLIAVLPAGSKREHDRVLRTIIETVARVTGIEADVDSRTATTGVKRSAVFSYPTARAAVTLSSGVLVELGTRGGALPARRLPVQSLLVEHADAAGLPLDFDEVAPVSILVVEPERTLVDKLVLLHHAASEGDERRKALTARHYYDVDRLLRSDAVLARLADSPVDVIAREVCAHSRDAGLSTADRPQGGFATSPAWDPAVCETARRAYDDIVLRSLVWPGAPHSSFDECCERVRALGPHL
jgi:hypothetical protein